MFGSLRHVAPNMVDPVNLKKETIALIKQVGNPISPNSERCTLGHFDRTSNKSSGGTINELPDTSGIFKHYFTCTTYICYISIMFCLHTSIFDPLFTFDPLWKPPIGSHSAIDTTSSIILILYTFSRFSFYQFSPLSYGTIGPAADNATSPMSGLKWMDSWEF